MPKFKVLTPIDLDNKRYEPGKTTPDIDADTAEPLLAVGAVEPVAETSAKKADDK